MTTHTASDYTSPPDQLSSPSSLTPTRHALQQTSMLDFTSPSAYLNHDAYNHTSPNTPHGSACLHDLTYDMHGSASAPPASIDETFAYAYGDYSAENGYMPMAPIDHSTPSALRMEDDRTPVISDKQHPIQPSSLPCRPNVHGDETIRASSQSHRTLMSPFRTFSNQPNMMAFPESVSEQHQLIDPSQAFYPQPQPQPPQSYAYSNGSPHDPSGFVTMPQYVNMQPGLGGQIYPPPGQYYTQPLQPYDFPGPRPRSRNGSPTESVSSSAASIARSGSTSSELRQARPKVKLTFEDKRNIVELHRANSSLRQEDIARQYGVDRSTISKIILSAHRWTQPQEVQLPAIPKPLKAVGGRFPAIEQRMDDWWSQQIANGLDVRDNVARDKAKAIAREIGFPLERFKASAKWLDKFKDRRKAAGKPTTAPMHVGYGYYPYTNQPYPMMSPMNGSAVLSRSQSAATLSSSDSSSQEIYQPSPNFVPMDTPNRMMQIKSEPDLSNLDMTPGSRQRSQSSPQLVGEPGMQSPSSGKAMRLVRPSPLNLQRQNSYHGSSPSPRRPAQLVRSSSTQVGNRRSRPTSLAASAFGITPIIGEAYSPVHSPSTSSNGTHSRQRSETSLAPFTTSMSGMTISPDMSDSGEPGSIPMPMTIPPLTPITPAHGQSGGVFPNTDYGVISAVVTQHYATMPNKHYGAPHFVYRHDVYAPQDFGQGYMVHHPEASASGSWL